ncbi:hypothetical protein [Longibacter sp.]|uniref:hypothetical protein n=1 Tax=Longibacter sp. TaxID=2045415 RepID=UPI003EBE3F11
MPMLNRTLLSLLLLLWAAPLALHAQSPTDLSALSDEFNDPTALSEWTRLAEAEGWTDKLKTLDVDAPAPGALYLEPYPSVWFYDYTAPLLFKTVEGNFVVTTRIDVSGADGTMPSTTYSLAGLMARRPRPDAPFTADSAWAKDRENYVFLVTGTTGEPGVPKIETKSAVRSQPIVKHYPRETSGWIELRLVRLNQTVIALYRRPEADWQIHERFYRPDLPSTLQVGLMAYGDYATVREQTWYDPWAYNTSVLRNADADMQVTADYVRFRRPQLSDEATTFVSERNLHWDDYRISNEKLVALCPFLLD